LESGQDITILIVDDREANRDILVKLLQSAGFATVTAVNGQEGLDRMRERSFPLVLMDVRMPVMNGIDATSHIRQDPELKDTIVIAVTASVFPEFKNRAKEAGFDDFIAKPLRAAELFSKIESHLNVRYAKEEPAPEAEHADTSDQELSPELAAEIVTRLQDAVRMRNISALTALAAELQSKREGGAALGARIARLAGSFDFGGLESLVQELNSNSDS
ncbi:MAG: response regulator, partial [Planctomycetota bacterium]|nr:response regulator [Planctomycetota bacterium]